MQARSAAILVSRIIGLFFFFGVLLNLGVAAYFYQSSSAFIRKAVAVPGVVSTQVSHTNDEGSTTYSLKFDYTDLQGTARSAESSANTNPPLYNVGDKVDVLYDPAKPADARIKCFTELWLLSTIFAGVSVVPLAFAIVGVVIVPFAIKRAGRKASDTSASA